MLGQVFGRVGRLTVAGSGIAGLAVASLVAFTSPADAGGKVYVPLGGENKVVVIDAAKDKVVGSIAGLLNVHGLAKAPDGKFLIAGSFDEREPGAGLPARPAGVSAEEHAAHHAKSAHNAGQPKSVVSTVSIVRLADGQVVRRIDVPGGVHHVAASADGRFAAVTHPGYGATTVIDLKSYTVLATVKTGPDPNYAAFSPDGRRLFVSSAGSRSISEVSTKDWTVGRRFAVGESPEHLVLSRDGSRLYVNNVGDGTVSVVDTRDGKSVETIKVGEDPHGIDLSDDGKTLYVAVMGANKVVAVDLASGKQKSLTLPPSPYHLGVLRGLGKIYVTNVQGGNLWAIDARTFTKSATVPIVGLGHQLVYVAQR